MRNAGKILVLGAVLALLGCNKSRGNTHVSVSAASSLYDVMERLSALYSERQPDVEIGLNYGASSTLARQIVAGAPVDLFVSANGIQMDHVENAGLIHRRQDLLTNTMVLVGRRGDVQAGISLRETLKETKGRIGIASPAVPAGDYGRRWLKAAGLWSDVRSRLVPMKHVRQVLNTVAAGNVVAGFVYKTDLRGASSDLVEVITASTDQVGAIIYPVGLVNADNVAAAAFMTWLRGDEAVAVFKMYGFGMAK